MTDVAQVLRQRPEARRNQYGQYLVKGKAYTRVTTLASTLEDRFNLEKWQQRMVAIGLAERQDLYAGVASTPNEDKKKLNKLCEQAIEAAKGTAGANLGSALHAFTERVDLGEEISIPAPWNADVAAYRAALDAHGIKIVPEYVERIVVNHKLNVAGTFDRLAEVPGLGLTICDLKTAADFLPWGSISIQLSAYARAEEFYDPVTDETSPMPFVNTEFGVVIHLPVGTARCELHVVDLSAGWEMAQTATSVRAWRKRRDLARPLALPATSAPAAATPVVMTEADVKMRDWLYRRIAALRDAGHLDELAAAWPDGVPTLKAAESHDAAQLRRIDAAVGTVEVAHAITPPSMNPFADDSDVEAMVSRLTALPPDVLEAVQDRAKAAGLPPVRRMTDEQLGDLGVILARVESDLLRASA